VPDDKLLEVALIENIQRENLNPIDQAHAYRRLLEEAGMTQEALSSAIGRDRASIANHLRLLKLPEAVRRLVADETLSVGHAKALLGLTRSDQVEAAAQTVVSRGLSVREAEALVRRVNDPAVRRPEPPKDVHTREAEEKLRLALGTRTRIVRHGTRGRIEIEFVSEDELQRLYEQLTSR
jgi:ParB family chromosome partitioning protein